MFCSGIGSIILDGRSYWSVQTSSTLNPTHDKAPVGAPDTLVQVHPGALSWGPGEEDKEEEEEEKEEEEDKTKVEGEVKEVATGYT